MPTIIYPPSIPWNWMVQRPQQILSQLAQMGYTILYEDLGTFPNPAVQHLSSSFTLCQGVSALTVPHSRPRILWLTVPSHINLIDDYQPDVVVYDAVDEPKEEFASWAPYYPTILQRSHLMFASGKSIYEHLRLSHSNVHWVPNGVDYPFFSTQVTSRPADLPQNQLIIGYSGALASWVDWDLLKFVISGNPDCFFVFIGTLFYMKQFPLKLPNASYLGLKPYAHLPSYLQNFDLGIIPFRLTEMTKGCNPIKLYEYYAAGLPVLATPLAELLTVPHINLESDPKRFSALIKTIIQSKSLTLEERKNFAQANDWSNIAKIIHSELNKLLVC